MTRETVEVTESVFYSLDKPLSKAEERTLELLIERYTQEDGSPLIKFETESLVAIRVPWTIKFKERAQ